MSKVTIYSGELWFLRQLLLKKSGYSFNDLLTVNNITYPSFQIAAIEEGYVADNEEALVCFREAVNDSTPSDLRRLFINLTLNGFPTLAIYNDIELQLSMIQDYIQYEQHSERNAKTMLIKEISKLLQNENRNSSEFGLPEPEIIDTELKLIRERYDSEEQLNLFNQLMLATPPTEDEQLPFLNQVFHCIDNNIGRIFIIQGEGGSGKTTMAKIVAAYIRSKKLIVLGCASTALAASIYTDFDTAHSLFKIPVVEDEDDYDQENDLKCDLEKYPHRQELLNEISAFIWDEIGPQHVRDFNAVLSLMNNFDNKVVILIGDKMQNTPVVVNGTETDIIKASIYSSIHMNRFVKIKFTHNLRLIGQDLPHQQEYAIMLKELGTGKYYKEQLRIDKFQYIPIVIADEIYNIVDNSIIESASSVLLHFTI